ncbi:MAG: 50S ribosomal protein L11 methyltransferase [Verrucomicrobiota bacterium]
MSDASPNSAIFLWRRLVPTHALDVWLERISWVGLEKCVSRELPGKKRASLEVYCSSEKEAIKLKANYGGEFRRLKKATWQASQKPTFFLPIPPHCCIVAPGVKIPDRYTSLPRIELPAGMAFGTGDHPTTAMCLRQLLQRLGNERKRVLDMGTGSGILALAAALRGHEVVAVDNDPESIREAHKNAKRNPRIPKIEWKLGRAESLDTRAKFDVVVANLFLSILTAALPRFRKVLKTQGTLILSGVLHEQEAEILATLQRNGFRLLKRLKKGKWLCLVADRGVS